MAYGAFGQRRNESGWSGDVTSADWTGVASTSRRGYTFHETLDNLNLTHMNGRVYDQVTGRFLSPDPIVQAPGFTQSFNRYAYVFNNPLSYTDPSGYEAKSADGDDGAADSAGAMASSVVFGPYAAVAQLVRLWMGYGESPGEELRRKSLAEIAKQVPQFDSVQVPRTVNTEAADALVADTVANPKGVKGWDPKAADGKPYAVSREIVNAAVAWKTGEVQTRIVVTARCETDVDMSVKDLSCDGIASVQPELWLPVVGQGLRGLSIGTRALIANEVIVTAEGTANAAKGALLRMQLAAEEAAGARMPGQIAGYTKHGINQAISRDGVGVSPRAILDAFQSPIKISGQVGGRFVFVGKDAVVVVSSEGQIITTWATGSAGVRIVP